MEKFIEYPSLTCLFCGEEKKQKWEEYESYYECDCEDAKKNREIDDKIRQLDWSRPEKKFKIEKRDILIKRFLPEDVSEEDLRNYVLHWVVAKGLYKMGDIIQMVKLKYPTADGKILSDMIKIELYNHQNK